MSKESGGLDDQVQDQAQQHEQEGHQEAVESNIAWAYLNRKDFKWEKTRKIRV